MAKRGSKLKLLAVGVIAVIVLLFFIVPGFTGGNLGTLGGTGLTVKYCTYDTSGNDITCNSYTEGSVLSGTAPIGGVRVEASGAFKYSGMLQSWNGSGHAKICYNGTNDCDPQQEISGSGDPSNFGVKFTQERWTTEYLESKWGASFGSKEVQISVTDFTITAKFSELSEPVIKSYAYAKSGTFNLNYEETTGMSTTSTTSDSMTTTTTTTQTSTTTLSGGSLFTNSTDTWSTTIGAASRGVTGNLASNGIIVTLQPYKVQQGFTISWVYIPSSYAPLPCQSGTCGQLTVVTKDVSVSVFKWGLDPDSWIQLSVPAGTNVGDLVLAQVTDLGTGGPTIIFNQAVTVSEVTTTEGSGLAQLPPKPYLDAYNTWLSARTTTTTTTTVSGYTTYWTSTVGTDGATTSFRTSSTLSAGETVGCPYLSLVKCEEWQSVSVTF